MDSRPTPMPIAFTGPSPLVGFISATVMQSMPAATVALEKRSIRIKLPVSRFCR